MNGRHLINLAVACSFICMFTGCSLYHRGFTYDPNPTQVQIFHPAQADQLAARVLVSVIGVRRKDNQSQLPASVEVRFRVENQLKVPIRFESKRLTLIAANLQALESPIVRPQGDLQIAPRSTSLIRVYFPFPRDEESRVDLEGLNIRWTIRIGEKSIERSSQFSRRPNYYDNRPRVRFGVGLGYHFH